MKKFFLVVMICVLSICLQPAYSDPTAPVETEVDIIPITDSIYMLKTNGSANIGVCVGDDGVFMIDDKFASSADAIKTALAKISDKPLSYILNTHWHNDHTGGNEVFGKETVIIAHDNVRTRLSTRQELKVLNRIYEPKPEHALPVITFDSAMTFYFNGEQIKIEHFSPSHTDGDSVVFFTNSNVVHTGDLYFNGWYPFIDLNAYGSVQGMIASVNKLIGMLPSDVKIIPGHGPLSGLDDLKSFRDMLVTTSTIVKTAMDQGKSLDEIKAAGLPEEIDSVWGQAFLNADKWIELIYGSYTQE